MLDFKLCSIFVFLMFALGCGSSNDDSNQSELQALVGVISSVQEKSSHPSPAKTLFEKVPPMPELKRYAAIQFEIIGSPSVSGDTAKVNVKATDQSGKDIGTAIWSLKKSANGWMLSDSPIPTL